ncbi:MAG: hypothetical protein JXQ65_14220 [Candidatus Marinimicrobia bacterium]|nr:hypothetical protein [Candidatus Neomarinimicrobiota bacterium]
MKKIFVILFVFLMLSSVFAEIVINGDARIRPRLDVSTLENNGTTSTTRDMYYMYWARLWVTAKLTEGWYFQTKLATDGPANFTGKLGGSHYGGTVGWTDANAAHSAGRGVVRFAEVHFGRKMDNYGFSMGILPLSGLENPEFDLHFFPTSKSDIPYTILNAASAAGFRGFFCIGENRLNATITVDRDQVQYKMIEVEDMNGDKTKTEDELKDYYSLFLDYQMKFGDLKVAPTLIYSMTEEDEASPMTVGANVALPKMAGFGLSAGGYYTLQSQENNVGLSKYSGPMIHLKATKPMGPGTFSGWVDWKSITIDDDDDAVATTLLWLMYKYTVYKSEFGTFWLAPTYRLMLQNYGDMNYSRNKIEVTLHMDFK